MKELTPREFMCHTDNCCPAVFETDDSYVIIGKKLSGADAEAVAGRVGADEYVIKVEKGMIDKMK